MHEQQYFGIVSAATRRSLQDGGWVLSGILLVFLILWIDLKTPDDFSLVVLYTVPIVGLTIARGRNAGIAVAIVAALAWTYDTASSDGFQAISFGFNTVSRFAIFLGIVVLIDMYRRSGERLAAIDRHREDSLALVAHKLRDTAARMGSLTSGLPTPDQPHARDNRLALDRQARELRRMAEDVLDVNLLENGRFRLDTGEVDLTELTADVAHQFGGGRVQLVVQAEPVVVEADADRLRVMLEHIITNAVKFSPANSEVFVTVSGSAGEAKVVVRDHGVGFARSDLSLLFQRYGQARTATRSGPTATKTQGIGLGLYVTRLLAEAHGGTVKAESAGPGLGSTFRITLPKRQHRSAHA